MVEGTQPAILQIKLNQENLKRNVPEGVMYIKDSEIIGLDFYEEAEDVCRSWVWQNPLINVAEMYFIPSDKWTVVKWRTAEDKEIENACSLDCKTFIWTLHFLFISQY